MKSARTRLGLICTLTAAGLAIGVAVERQAGAKLAQENAVLLQQLSQVDGLLAENQRLSNLAARAKASPSANPRQPDAPAAAEERLKELARLRGEVEVLRQQGQEIENLREDTRQLRLAGSIGLRGPNGLTSTWRPSLVTESAATASPGQEVLPLWQ